MITEGGCGVTGELCFFYYFGNKIGNIIAYFLANGSDSIDR